MIQTPVRLALQATLLAGLSASALYAQQSAPTPNVDAVPTSSAFTQAPVDAEAEARRISTEAFRRALILAGRKDWVFATAEAQAAGPAERDVITWLRLRAGDGTFDDYDTFLKSHHDWPGLPALRRRVEAQLTTVPADTAIRWFATSFPQTGQGAMSLIAALQSKGQDREANRVIETVWQNVTLTDAEEAAFLARYGDVAAPFTDSRMTHMLDRGEITQASRLLAMVPEGSRALATARLALQRRLPGVDRLINEIPADLRDSAGLDRDRVVWRWRMSMEDGAAEVLLARSDSAESLGDPAMWANVRGQLARFYLRRGDAALAYKIAARHRMPPGGAAWADLEWLAGYAALILGDAPVALTHFERFSQHVGSPISISRGAYWRGRALDYLGRTADAEDAYREGARWQTSFYGLLSAQRLGLPLDPELSTPEALPQWSAAAFTHSSLFAAAAALRLAGDVELSRRFLLQLEENVTADQIPAMAALAEDWDDAYLALVLAKRAANSGTVLVTAYYPLPSLATHDLGVPEELALSIARRESEFDPAVISPAGARGLMQLMPATAELMAPVIGESYDRARLTTDPTYNARLGGAYLAQLRSEFGTSPVLVASGYNAGPVRARRWIAEQGDPRLPETDIVDWIENIPFTETRDYVMRVAESLPVYRARLGQGTGAPLTFIEELHGSAPPAPVLSEPDPAVAVPDGPDASGADGNAPPVGPVGDAVPGTANPTTPTDTATELPATGAAVPQPKAVSPTSLQGTGADGMGPDIGPDLGADVGPDLQTAPAAQGNGSPVPITPAVPSSVPPTPNAP